MDRKIVPEHSASVAILGKGAEPNLTMTLSFKAPVNEQNEHATTRDDRLITTPAKMLSPVVVLALK